MHWNKLVLFYLMIFFSLMNIIYGAVILLLERHLPAGVDLLCAHSAVI